MLGQNGRELNQKYEAEYEKKENAVQAALQQADKTGSKKDMEAYLKAVQARQDLITAGATDNKYYVKTKFKDKNDVQKELKRNGATVDKSGNVTASKDNQDVKTIIDAYNKAHKGNEIKVTWADGKLPDTKPKKNESDTKGKKSESGSKDSTSSKNEKPNTETKTETSGKENKSPSILDKINRFFKERQTKEIKNNTTKKSEENTFNKVS